MNEFYPQAEQAGIKILADRFNSRDQELRIGKVQDTSKLLESPFLPRLVEIYRDIYGHGPKVDKSGWGEYVKCANPRCEAQLSIEEIYHNATYVPLAELEKPPAPKLPNCVKCGSAMELFYPPEKLQQQFIQEFNRKAVEIVFLLDSQGTPYGFSYTWEDTLSGIWEAKLASLYRNSGLDLDSFLKQVRLNSQAKIQPDSKITYLAEIAHSFKTRGSDLFAKMIKNLFESQQIDQPCCFYTQESSRFYLLIVAAGARLVFQEENSPVKILMGANRAFSQAFEGTPEQTRALLARLKKLIYNTKPSTKPSPSYASNA